MRWLAKQANSRAKLESTLFHQIKTNHFCGWFLFFISGFEPHNINVIKYIKIRTHFVGSDFFAFNIKKFFNNKIIFYHTKIRVCKLWVAAINKNGGNFMKKLLAIMLVAVIGAGFCACGSDKNSNDSNISAAKGEVSVFYYTFSDAYISSVRSVMSKILKDGGYKYNDYDANGNQTTQTEQVQTALAKGSSMLIVNVVDTGSNDAAQNIINLAKAKNVPVIFFNRSVEQSVIESYEKCVFVGTDYEQAGHMQGKMIGEYLVNNYDKTDLNGDGKISYVLFKGQEGNMEAIARTQYAVEDANAVLKEAGKPELTFYDSANKNKYLVDQDGLWSSAAATNYMGTALAQYTAARGNMIELVIANNDEMALGAVSALQSAGFNKDGTTVIPVFGVDATDAAKSAIKSGTMFGTVKQDADGMATTITKIMQNYFSNNVNVFDGIDNENIVGSWRVNIPYSVYTVENAQ